MCHLINLVRPRHLSVNISLSLSASCFLFSCLLICSGLIWTLLSLFPFSPSLPSSFLLPSHHPTSSSLIFSPPPSRLLHSSTSIFHPPLYLTSSSPPFFPPPIFPPTFLPSRPPPLALTWELTLGKEGRAGGDPRWDRGSGSREMGLENEGGRVQSGWETLNELYVCVLKRGMKKWGRNRNSFHLHFAEAQSGSTQSSSLEDDQGCFLSASLLLLNVQCW